MLRKPAVAGSFYPANLKQLEIQLEAFLKSTKKPRKALGIVCPHAGYIYSGKVAGEVYSQIKIPLSVVILSPNHTGMGERASIMLEGEWELPNGKMKINSQLANLIKDFCPLVKEDELAHLREHSLEVQLPFIKKLSPQTTFVPLTLMYLSLDECAQIGSAIAKAIEEYKEDVLIIASSDFTHFESRDSAKKKDAYAIEEIKKRRPAGLYEVVRKYDISMCGFIPTTIMLYATDKLGAKGVELVDYTTSGDVTGDYNEVVAYAGLIIK